MKPRITDEKTNDLTPHPTHYHMIDANTFTLPRSTTSNLNDLSPRTIHRAQQPGSGRNDTLRMHNQSEIIQLHPNTTASFNGLSNPCYFASYNDTIDRYDLEQQQVDNRVRVSIRGGQNNNNNNNIRYREEEDTKF